MAEQNDAVRDAMRGAVSEARRRARQATEVDHQVRDKAVGVLVTGGMSVGKARRAVGMTRRERAHASAQMAGAVLRRWAERVRGTKYGVNSPMGPEDRRHLLAVHGALEEIWTVASATTSQWHSEDGLHSDLVISRNGCPVPDDRQNLRMDTAAAEFTNVVTGEKVLVYSFERWNGGPGADGRGTYRILRIDGNGNQILQSPADYGLGENAGRFGGGWSPPAPGDNSVFEALVSAIQTQLAIVPDAIGATPASELRAVRRRRAQPDLRRP
ncbi:MULTISPECIES: hypothetical protein [unclassified Rhodococcus (in: high G+C Gram-positive bacteria)]|uniref:hypothetical protein n=1 Tax=unclassified Rhodococcus (in: high G+C Gram-positive bacteria) TaxID=192944 RepID=UPI00163A233F|nr:MULTISPECIES: hypothetical protein [unclassified Rhodococcus (in: high G+C Gram-positive bacteria)]MBC2644311.1 hypothetical protein [Rhodococcus sp. 3A]MBC2897996.1 hypothetical protein [Rhodococcus sp. 4CII]